MSEDFDDALSPAEREVAAALAGLRPARPAFTPADVRHAAALARARRSVWTWRAVAAAGAVAATVSFVARPSRTVERVVYADAPTPAVVAAVGAPVASTPARLPYLELRDAVLAGGAAALDAPTAAAPGSIRVRSAIHPTDF